MGNRFKTRELKRVLSIIHYDVNDYESMVKIFGFLQWLKNGVFKTRINKEIKEEAKKEVKETKEEVKETKEEVKETKEEVKETKEEVKETKEEIKRDEMDKEMEEKIEREMEEEIETAKSDYTVKLINLMANNTKKIYNNLKKVNEDLCEQYCKNRGWFETIRNCKLKCLDVNQFIYDITPDDDIPLLVEALDHLKKGTLSEGNLPIDKILDIWTLFRDLQTSKIEGRYANIIEKMQHNQTKKQSIRTKHGGNHKRSHKRKKHKQYRTRKTKLK